MRLRNKLSRKPLFFVSNDDWPGILEAVNIYKKDLDARVIRFADRDFFFIESMNPDEEQIKATAIAFAKQHKKRIADELTNPAIYAPDDFPTSIFVAGSPGAGKTEFSKGLISKEDKRRVVRIDADDIRSQFPGYTGTNSYLFQSAVSLVVEKIHDYALHRKQT